MDLSSARKQAVKDLTMQLRAQRPNKEQFLRFVRILFPLIKRDFVEDEVVFVSEAAFFYFSGAQHRVRTAKDWQAVYYARKALVALYNERIPWKITADSCGLNWPLVKNFFLYQMLDDVGEDRLPGFNNFAAQVFVIANYNHAEEDLYEGQAAYLYFLAMVKQWRRDGQRASDFAHVFEKILPHFCIADRHKQLVVDHYVRIMNAN